MKTLTAALVIFTLVIEPAKAASFDCSKAKSNIELSICANNELGGLDDELLIAYKSSRDQLSDQGKSALKSTQNQWIKNLKSSCDTEKNYKTNKSEIEECLINEYRVRIGALKGMIRDDFNVYTVTSKNVSYEQIDSQDPILVKINSLAKSMMEKDLESPSNQEISINKLSPGIFKIESQSHYEGGAHPDFSQSFAYIDSSGKNLTSDALFDKSKIKELTILLNKEIRQGLDKDGLECYANIDAGYIKDAIKNVNNISLGKTSMAINLSVPRYCRSMDFAEVPYSKISGYLTPYILSELSLSGRSANEMRIASVGESGTTEKSWTPSYLNSGHVEGAYCVFWLKSDAKQNNVKNVAEYDIQNLWLNIDGQDMSYPAEPINGTYVVVTPKGTYRITEGRKIRHVCEECSRSEYNLIYKPKEGPEKEIKLIGECGS